MPKMSQKKVNMVLKKSNVVMTKKDKKSGKYKLVPKPTVPYNKAKYTA